MRSCGNEGCKSTNQSSKLYNITVRCSAGGRDWSSLHGSVLCNSCYTQFKTSGTLRAESQTILKSKPLTASLRKCSYAGCDSPHESCQFHLISGNNKAGGQDWRSLEGQVLCKACYLQFKRCGSLVRMRYKHKPLIASAEQCTYKGCEKPYQSSRFYQISGDSKAGGRVWTSLSGNVLCIVCYNQFMRRGTLERTIHRHKSLETPVGQCICAGCDSQDQNRKFIRVSRESRAGGQDWTWLDGCELCKACYAQYLRKGTLVRRKSGSCRQAAGPHESSPDPVTSDGDLVDCAPLLQDGGMDAMSDIFGCNMSDCTDESGSCETTTDLDIDSVTGQAMIEMEYEDGDEEGDITVGDFEEMWKGCEPEGPLVINSSDGNDDGDDDEGEVVGRTRRRRGDDALEVERCTTERKRLVRLGRV